MSDGPTFRRRVDLVRWKEVPTEVAHVGEFEIVIFPSPMGGYRYSIRGPQVAGAMPFKSADIAKEIAVGQLRDMLQKAIEELEA